MIIISLVYLKKRVDENVNIGKENNITSTDRKRNINYVFSRVIMYKRIIIGKFQKAQIHVNKYWLNSTVNLLL